MSKDDSSEWSVWQHAIGFIEKDTSESLDAIIVLPVTAPLRSIEDINACIDLYEDGMTDSVITVSKAQRNPYFNMVVNHNDYATIVNSPNTSISRRQDAPEVFDMTTVAYVVNTNFIKHHNGIFEGRVKSVVVPRERAIDIDDLIDFKIAELFSKS